MSRPRKFTAAEVRAALIAGRGVNTWAATVLAEATGRRCSSMTIGNYIQRFPELAEVAVWQRQRLVDAAERNVVEAIEAGDLETSRWLMRNQMAARGGPT